MRLNCSMNALAVIHTSRSTFNDGTKKLSSAHCLRVFGELGRMWWDFVMFSICQQTSHLLLFFVCKLKQLFSIEMAKWIHRGVERRSPWHTISDDFEFINSDKNGFACNFIDSISLHPSIEIITIRRLLPLQPTSMFVFVDAICKCAFVHCHRIQ